MLREIEAHNQSPEAEDGLELATTRDLEDDFRETPLTRGARKSLMRIVKNGSLTPRKSLNVKLLMLAELSGAEKGTKRFYTEGSSDLGPCSYKKQRKDSKDLGFGDEEDDGEEALPNFSKTNDRGHPQSTPTHPPTSRQVGKVAGNSQVNKESSAESAWLTWDSQKGQSTPA